MSDVVTEVSGEGAAGTADAVAHGEYRRKRRMVGVVTSAKMKKTVAVEIRTTAQERRYKKFITRRAKYLVHDEKSECGVGDKVMIVETRPFSKRKTFRVEKIMEKAKE